MLHWSSLLALAACTPQAPSASPDPEPGPLPEETGAPTGDTASSSVRAAATWTTPQTWSDRGVDNHATVTFDALGAPVVAWTQGMAIGPSWVQVLDLTGARVGPVQGLGTLQIPDVHGSPTGLYIGAHLADGGVWLLHGQPGETPDRLLVGDPSTASGSPSADIDVGSDGFVRVVWFSQGDPGRLYGHRVADDLSGLQGPPQVLAQTDGDTRMTPDTVAMADGGTLVAWVDQASDGPDELHVMALELDSSVRWDRVVVALDDASPRRPTVSTGADGRTLVVWRETTEEVLVGGAWAALDPDGTVIALHDLGVVERPIGAHLDDDTAVLVWETPDEQIMAGIAAFPDGTWRDEPQLLGDGRRPHVAVRTDGGAWRMVVSWENGDPGDRHIQGSIGRW